MNEDKIKNIIKEILELEPDMKKFEKEIKEIIINFSKNKPEAFLREDFKNELKDKIMKEVEKIKNEQKVENERKFSWPIFAKKMSFSVGALLIALIIIIPGISYFKNKDNKNFNITYNDQAFVRLSDAAFGKIPLSEEGLMSNVSPAKEAMTSSPGAEVASISNGFSSPVFGLGGDATVMNSDMPLDSPKILPYPYEIINYEYVYTGEEIRFEEEKVDVFKRLKSDFNGKKIADQVLGLDFKLLNLRNFKDGANVSSISINQDKDFGFIININTQDNSLSLYSNWSKWPQPYSKCQDEACFSKNRLSYSDIPNDEKIINISNKFLKENGISLDNYGPAIIQDYFRQEYEKASDKSNVYIPDEISVVYPLLINGQEVSDDGGNKSGLFVSVNIRHQRVSALSNLNNQNYEVSAYKAITENTLMKLIKQGGVYPSYDNPEAVKTVKIEIGNPEKILLRQYRYNEKTSNSDEFFVPALSFPVLNISDNKTYFWRKNIIIPLAQDMIEEQPRYDIMPIPEVLMR